MIDYGLRHIATTNEGERQRRRGEIRIDSDGKSYFYRASVPLGESRAASFKHWAECFLRNDGRDRIAGRFPFYWVKSR